jgi:hypothetical protein
MKLLSIFIFSLLFMPAGAADTLGRWVKEHKRYRDTKILHHLMVEAGVFEDDIIVEALPRPWLTQQTYRFSSRRGGHPFLSADFGFIDDIEGASPTGRWAHEQFVNLRSMPCNATSAGQVLADFWRVTRVPGSPIAFNYEVLMPELYRVFLSNGYIQSLERFREIPGLYGFIRPPLKNGAPALPPTVLLGTKDALPFGLLLPHSEETWWSAEDAVYIGLTPSGQLELQPGIEMGLKMPGESGQYLSPLYRVPPKPSAGRNHKNDFLLKLVELANARITCPHSLRRELYRRLSSHREFW